VPELLQEVAAHLVGSLVLRDLLADQEDVGIAPHLLGHGAAQRVADGLPDQVRARRDVGVHQRLDRRDRGGPLAFPTAAGAGRRRAPDGARAIGLAETAPPGAASVAAAAGWVGAAAPTPSPSRAIGVLTFTPCAPSGTRMASTLPSSTASTSIVALSVSISA